MNTRKWFSNGNSKVLEQCFIRGHSALCNVYFVDDTGDMNGLQHGCRDMLQES